MRYRFDQDIRRKHKWRNVTHSVLLLGGMGLVLAVCAFGLFDWIGALAVVCAGAIAAMATPQIAPEWVIRAHSGQRLTSESFPQGTSLVETLAQRAGLNHVPALYYIPSRMLNAFATGTRENAAIAITDGLIRRLSVRELAGVLAHEMSHIDNNDLWLMGVADVLSRMTATLSYLGMFALGISLIFGQAVVPFWISLLLIAAPTICSLLQLALSRAREYDADLEAATLTGDPHGLASALAKLERIQGRYWEEIMLPGRRMPDPSLLRTHPPTEERISRLQSLIRTEPEMRWPVPRQAALASPFAADPGRPRFVWPGFWR